MKTWKAVKIAGATVLAGAWLTAMGLGASAWFDWGNPSRNRDRVASIDASYERDSEDRRQTDGSPDSENLSRDDDIHPSKISSAAEWAERCESDELYNRSGCKTFSTVFYKAGITPGEVGSFLRQDIDNPVAMIKMTKACDQGSCKVASSGEISGDDSGGSPADFAARCKNSGIQDIDDCAAFARTDSSPTHYSSCIEEGVRDAYACLLMRKTKAPSNTVRRWLTVWDVDAEHTDCYDSETSRPDPTPWRHKNIRAIFAYLVSDQEPIESAIHPPENVRVPPAVADAFNDACVSPREASKLHAYGVPPQYYTDMHSVAKVGPSEVIITAWYGCVSADEVRAEVEAGAENLYEAVQRIDQRRDPHRVREILRSMDTRDCDAVLEELASDSVFGEPDGGVDDPSFPMKIPLAPNPYR